MNALMAVLITANLLGGFSEQREIYRTLAECEVRVMRFGNESFFHRGFCAHRSNLTEADVRVYGGWKEIAR